MFFLSCVPKEALAPDHSHSSIDSNTIRSSMSNAVRNTNNTMKDEFFLNSLLASIPMRRAEWRPGAAKTRAADVNGGGARRDDGAR